MGGRQRTSDSEYLILSLTDRVGSVLLGMRVPLGLFRCTINCGSYQIFVLYSVQLVGSKVNVRNGKPKLTSRTLRRTLPRTGSQNAPIAISFDEIKATDNIFQQTLKLLR